MNKVVKHPCSDRGRLTQLDRLATEVGIDRARAIVALSNAVGDLEALCRLCDAPDLRTMASEYRDSLSALTKLDPTRVDDELSNQLVQIELKLKGSLQVLDRILNDRTSQSSNGMQQR